MRGDGGGGGGITNSIPFKSVPSKPVYCLDIYSSVPSKYPV